MKLYVDDLRKCPEGWTVARTITETIRYLYHGNVTHISLDHDIAYLRGPDIRMHKESFMSVAMYLSVMPLPLRPESVRIHTSNVDAGWKMETLLRKAGYADITVIPLGDQVLDEDIQNLKRTL